MQIADVAYNDDDCFICPSKLIYFFVLFLLVSLAGRYKASPNE